MAEKQDAKHDTARADQLTAEQLETVTAGLLPQIAPVAVLISAGGGELSSSSGKLSGAGTSAGGTKNVGS